MTRQYLELTPATLADHPELSALEMLDKALEIASLSIIAVHPDLPDTGLGEIPTLQELAADHLLAASETMQRLIASYRAVVDTYPRTRDIQRPLPGLHAAGF